LRSETFSNENLRFEEWTILASSPGSTINVGGANNEIINFTSSNDQIWLVQYVITTTDVDLDPPTGIDTNLWTLRLNEATTVIDDQKRKAIMGTDPSDNMAGAVYVQGNSTSSISPTVDIAYLIEVNDASMYIILTQLADTAINL
jgi:hypothetical protein